MHELEIRDARDDDSLDLIGLVARCWSEYPGCVLDVHGEEPELLTPASSYAASGGRVWVAERDHRIVASIALRPGTSETVQLQKLYVDLTVRRLGLGTHLVGVAEAEARSRSASVIEAWSDTRFTDAHRLYERLGYERQPETRALNDLSNTVEYQFVKRY